MSVIDESIFPAWSSTPWLPQTMVSGGGAASVMPCVSGKGGNGGTPPMARIVAWGDHIDPEPDTPRCNEAFALSDSQSRADFARQLERELASMTKERDEWRDKAEAYRLAAARRDEEMNHQAERAARWRQCAESLAKHVRAEFDDEAAELKRFYELKNREDGVQS